MKNTYISTSKEADPAEYSDSRKKQEHNVYQYKIILLGDISVGKTSILRRFIENDFSSEYVCTVGVEFRIKTIYLENKIGADLKIWDTCGEEKYRTITRQYYRDSNGVLLVFDLSNASSFDKLQEWYDDVIANGPRDLHVLLVGNKKDITEREVKMEMVQSFIKEHEGIDYIETSALTGDGISEAFRKLAERLIQFSMDKDNRKGSSDEKKEDSYGGNSYVLNDTTKKPAEEKKKSGGCC